MFTPPANALGADLIWWRTSDGMRTVVTVLWGRVQEFADAVHLQAVLFDAQGEPVEAWRIELPPDQPVFIDSAADGPWRRSRGADGVLALYVCTEGDPSAEARSRYNRLFPLLDWQLADGRVASLHSDQTISRNPGKVQEFTEIVVLESADERNALVLLNGEEPQAENALELIFRNASGASRSASYPSSMQPFTAHRIELAALLPELVDFSGGQPLLVSGIFNSRGLFSRPYVETTGKRWGAYHGGGIYHWSELPYVAHALIGGEVNPAAVLHDEHTRTYVNILHSHGAIEDDVAVDAALFDANGTCLARRPGWRIASRHGLARGDIAELLPDPARPFRGHIALTFAPSRGQAVPRRLQALLEYRRTGSVARVMTWSDEWNSPVRLAKRDRSAAPPSYRSWFRVWQDDGTTTEFAITNAGHNGYDRPAEIHAIYFDHAGGTIETQFSLPAYATRMTNMEQLFPEAIESLRSPAIGVVVLESASDLASVAYTHHHASGTMSAEHFMWLQSEHDGTIVSPSGS
jgi:hypothetical protein